MTYTTPPIIRDRLTWLTYLMMGYYSYLLNGLGPIMPFLRAEMNMSYTIGSLHFSAFAIGILFAGLVTDRLARKFGRRCTFWSGGGGMMIGALLLLFGRHPIITIGGTFIMGAIGSFLLALIPAILSERYGNARAVAISEANIAASLCGSLASVTVGGFASMNLGWRNALGVVLLGGVVLRVLFRDVEFLNGSDVQQTQTSSSKLPGVFWDYWVLLILAVSVEFCIIFWSATFLEVERHLLKANAALAMSSFLGAMMLGRLLGSRVSQHLPSELVVLLSVGVSLTGFIIHWCATPVVLAIAGLFLTGIGVSNLYPQLLSLTVAVVPHQNDTASARASLASGIAILCLPLILGGFADRIGIRNAYGLVLILIVLIGAGILMLHLAALKSLFPTFFLNKQRP